MRDIFLKIVGYKSLHAKHEFLGRPITILVFLLVFSPIILSIVTISYTHDPLLVSSIFFNAISPIQYALGIRYLLDKHILTILKDYRKQMIGTNPIFYLICAIFIIGSLGIAALIIILVVFNTAPPEFDMLFGLITDNTIQYRCTMSWLIIGWIFSSYILAINMSIFAFVFNKHYDDILQLQSDLESDTIWKMDQFSFPQLSRKIIEMRYIINQSVDKLESFYTTMTIVGAIGIGPIIEYKRINVYLIYYIIVYGICQFVFLYFIYYISKSKEDILNLLKSPKVMFAYLENIKKMQTSDFLQSNIKDIGTLTKYKIMAYASTGENIEEGVDDPSFHSIRNIEEDVLTMCYKNNTAIDWIILQGILEEQWLNFNLLGINFNDTDVIKKGIGMISLLIIASSFVNSLTIFN